MWTTYHQRAFDTLKEQVSNTVNLCYFYPSLLTKVQLYASLLGLGAAFIQTTPDNKERVIVFASKSMADTESRYANIERETLAVVFRTERFHTFLYSSKFVVESDHKPLAAIHLKNISQAPLCLQRMLPCLQPYDVTIVYRPDRELVLADALSRLKPREADTIQLEQTIHNVSLDLKVSDHKWQKIQS